MLLEEVQTVLKRSPFVPLRLRKVDGKTLDIPFRHVAVPLNSGLLVMKGVKNENSREAKGYEVVGYQNIDRIEPRSNRSRRSRS